MNPHDRGETFRAFSPRSIKGEEATSRRTRSADGAEGGTEFDRSIHAYLQSLLVRGCTEATEETRRRQLVRFVRWCEERDIRSPHEVTRSLVERYQRHLYAARTPRGTPLAAPTQAALLIAVKLFFRWMVRSQQLAHSPAAELELPRRTIRLPKRVLTTQEAERVLMQPDLRMPTGLRNRAILEVLYATGIRRGELIGVRVYDVDAAQCTLRIRHGKGRKERIVPLGARALSWVLRYLVESRPALSGVPDDGTLFLLMHGRVFTRTALTGVVRTHVRGAGLGKIGACHLFRHTVATLMLDNGADVRHVQELLGHAELSTTQIYTRVSIKKLQEVHAKTHPGLRSEQAEAIAATSILEAQTLLWEQLEEDDENELETEA